jgi:hypothetical protein
MDISQTNLTFIVAAYAVTWIAVLAYMARVTRGAARARHVLEAATSAGGPEVSR